MINHSNYGNLRLMIYILSKVYNQWLTLIIMIKCLAVY